MMSEKEIKKIIEKLEETKQQFRDITGYSAYNEGVRLGITVAQNEITSQLKGGK